ncbi:hypothetical protein [Streptomyces sp. B6B3]|uniref:hypothetical protein n=1 Tax=Streptomyces sp. B6B3 TaxID=3153570 RepID=UPI00325D6166
MRTTATKRFTTVIAVAIAASAILIGPSAQAHARETGDLPFPCGPYNPGDGLLYFGNCDSTSTLVSVSAPGIDPRFECVPARTAVLLGVDDPSWTVVDLDQPC